MEIITNLFSAANTWLTDNFGDLGPLLIIGVLGMFLILLTLPIMLKKEKDPFEQLKRDAEAGARQEGEGPRLRRCSAADPPADLAGTSGPDGAFQGPGRPGSTARWPAQGS